MGNRDSMAVTKSWTHSSVSEGSEGSVSDISVRVSLFDDLVAALGFAEDAVGFGVDLCGGGGRQVALLHLLRCPCLGVGGVGFVGHRVLARAGEPERRAGEPFASAGGELRHLRTCVPAV